MPTYVGIADAHGIESFIPEKDAKTGLLQLRASANRHRHAVVYKVTDLSEEDAKSIGNLMEKQDYFGALNRIRKLCELSKGKLEVERNFSKSWNLLPNHYLDPYY